MARPGFTTDSDHIVSALLADGNWYDVAPGSFELGAWEVTHPDALSRGVEAARLGFRFSAAAGGEHVSGPIAALLGVRTREPEGGEPSPG